MAPFIALAVLMLVALVNGVIGLFVASKIDPNHDGPQGLIYVMAWPLALGIWLLVMSLNWGCKQFRRVDHA